MGYIWRNSLKQGDYDEKEIYLKKLSVWNKNVQIHINVFFLTTTDHSSMADFLELRNNHFLTRLTLFRPCFLYTGIRLFHR